MAKLFEVSANGCVFGIYEAADEQGARDACAVDAGYKSEADMIAQLEQPSELEAVEKKIAWLSTASSSTAMSLSS